MNNPPDSKDEKELELIELEKITQQNKEKLLESFQKKELVLSSFKGPLPSPSQLQKYNELIENGAERFMQMLEKEQASSLKQREELQAHEFFIIKAETELFKEHIRTQMLLRVRGQILGFIISIIVFACSVTCILSGHAWPGAFLGVGGLSGLVAVFVLGRQKKSLEKKEQDEY